MKCCLRVPYMKIFVGIELLTSRFKLKVTATKDWFLLDNVRTILGIVIKLCIWVTFIKTLQRFAFESSQFRLMSLLLK